MCIATGTMPPKPSQRLSAKRRRVNSPGSSEAPNFTCASDSVRNDLNPIQSSSSGVNTLASQIDYAELAKHIVAQQRQQGTEIQQEASAQPQTITDSTPVSSSMLNGSEGNQDVSASNLSSLLDNVFTGESASRSQSQMPIELCDSVPLGATVSQKIKQKIWNHEFVDLKSLLPSSGEEPLAITVKAGKIEVNQASNNKTPLSINQWTDAFLIFASIYLQKFPNDACNILKYAFTVREISRLHVDQAWRNYDESFRRIRESSVIPWERPIAELRLKAASMGVRQANKPQTYKANKGQSFRSTKVCFAYNKGQRCNTSPCKYAHLCQECNGQHPKFKCTGAKSNWSTSQPQSNNANASSSNPNKPGKFAK